jgi:hypothetical protein
MKLATGDPPPHPAAATLRDAFAAMPGGVLLPESLARRILGMLPHHRLGERVDGLARDQPGEDEPFDERPADGERDGGKDGGGHGICEG